MRQQIETNLAQAAGAPWRPALLLIAGLTGVAGMLWWNFGESLYAQSMLAAIIACF